MSQTGNSTYTKSMNGIITFDDGAGTVIEDGAIQTDTFSTTNFNATDINATTIDATTVNSDTVNVDNIQNILDTNIYMYSNVGATRELFIGDLCSTVIGAGSLTITPTTVKADNLSGVATGDAISLYTATTGNISLGKSGRINLGENRFFISGDDLKHSVAASDIELFTSTTGQIEIGQGGRINFGLNRMYVAGTDLLQTVAGTAFNLFNTTTASITLGGSGRINFGTTRLFTTGSDLLNTTAGTAVNLFNTTTGIITLGLSGRINLGTNRLYTTGNDLLHTTAATAVNLLNTTTGAITLGLSGKINLGNVISITGNTIESLASSETINMFNNILTGTYNLMTGVRTAGSINIATNGSTSNTAPVNIGGDNSNATTGIVSRIRLNLNGNTIWSNTETQTSFRSGGGINLATYAGSNGTINIGNEAGTTTTVNIGVGGSGKNINLNGNTTAIATANTTISSTTTTINNDLTIGSNKSVFTTSGQQIRLGYANTQTSATSSSSFGPYIKSFGPDAVTSTTYDILYEGTNGLFPTGCDGCGGLLTIFMKSGASKYSVYQYSVGKRLGATTFAGMQNMTLNVQGFVAIPSISGSGNNIRITFNASDWSGATVSWMFLGSI